MRKVLPGTFSKTVLPIAIVVSLLFCSFLSNAQGKVEKPVRRSQKPIAPQLEILMQRIQQPSRPINKIAMPTMEGLQMIEVEQIISCESDSNYTILHLEGGYLVMSDGSSVDVSRSRKEDLLKKLLPGRV